MRIIGAAIVAFGLLALFGWAGGAVALGAHPFWGLKVCLIGGAAGVSLGAVVAGLVMARRGGTLWAALAGLGLTLIAFWISGLGKERFASSYAEDVFGGKMWFFGAIAMAAGAALVLAVLFSALLALARRR